MSASLVGSEMCIRDRVPASCARTGGQARGDGECLDLSTFGSQEDSGAVSYTHLTLPTICSV
eukprot:10631108-Alexandrium_andersonii.AAC.1